MEQTVSMQEMKEALIRKAGSKFPLKITLKDGQEMVRYFRGFADQQTNILLISENAHSLAMKIVELKDIRTLAYGEEHTDGQWSILHAKWLRTTPKLSVLFFLW